MPRSIKHTLNIKKNERCRTLDQVGKATKRNQEVRGYFCRPDVSEAMLFRAEQLSYWEVDATHLLGRSWLTTQPRYPTNIRGFSYEESSEIVSMTFLATDFKIVFVFIY